MKEFKKRLLSSVSQIAMARDITQRIEVTAGNVLGVFNRGAYNEFLRLRLHGVPEAKAILTLIGDR